MLRTSASARRQALVGIAGYATYGTVAVRLRDALQRRATGETGLVGVSSEASETEQQTVALNAIGTGLVGLGLTLQLLGAVRPVARLDRPAMHRLGLATVAASIGVTFWSQMVMGRSWRVGIDYEEKTELVTSGPFRAVRNPIFSCIVSYAAGTAMICPNPVSLAAVAWSAAALDRHVRVVEEPHLLSVHGEAYRDWAASAGRFLPGVGRSLSGTAERAVAASPLPEDAGADTAA
jgi:protein-S-isoprenylcysteine O-methyltransferase Ste14